MDIIMEKIMGDTIYKMGSYDTMDYGRWRCLQITQDSMMHEKIQLIMSSYAEKMEMGDNKIYLYVNSVFSFHFN